MTRRLARNVLVLSAVSFLTDVSSEMIYPLLPVFLASTLGAGAVAVGAIEGVAQAVAALMQVISGGWSDRVPRRKPLIVVGYGIASALRPLIGLATNVTQVLAIRVGDRIGKGMRGAPRDALIAESVAMEDRGRAFGFHRAADHAGAVIGPLAAYALLGWGAIELRTVFLLAAIPGALAIAVAWLGIWEEPRVREGERRGLGAVPSGVLAKYLVVLAIFTLGNSTDAFLLLRAREAGVPLAHLPLLWAFLHVVKSVASTPGGALSDRVGRRPMLLAGWAVYAAVYVGFGLASSALTIWGLMALYGLYHGLTEGTEKALVADLAGSAERGWAFGWFNLVLGLMALPASLLFGAIWDTRGAAVAFGFGAAMAGLASVLAWGWLPGGTKRA